MADLSQPRIYSDTCILATTTGCFSGAMGLLVPILFFLVAVTLLFPDRALAQNQSSCTSYLATNPNPAGIPSVTGPGVTQRNALLADGGKLVAIGSRYYTVWFPPSFYTASTPVVILDLHGTGGYPEAEWNDWHSALAAKGYGFIGLAWGGGAPGADTDTEIYANLKQIIADVSASCPIGEARKWLMGFSVGSAMSFAIMIRDVADQKMLSGQVAVSGAAIGPLTTGINVMHSTVEANRSNSAAVQGVRSWLYCGEVDFDHTWSMCDEMPYGESFINTHGGNATLFRDPTGSHHSLPTATTARDQMLDFLVTTDPGCTLTPQAAAYGVNGANGTITVACAGSWNSVSNNNWISLNSGASFNGNATLNYSVAVNSSGAARVGTLTLCDKSFTVRQTKDEFNDSSAFASWSKEYIYAIYAAGITTGCGFGDYCPTDSVTREQMATFIVRALHGDNFSYTQQPYYSDVPADAWSFKYVQKLKDLNLTTTTGSYDARGLVTREQMAAFIVRAKYGENFSYTAAPYYSDVQADAWSFKYVQKMKDMGFTNVMGSYGAVTLVTREQMAAFLSRAFLGML